MRALLVLLSLFHWAFGIAQSDRYTLTSCPACTAALRADFNEKHAATASYVEYEQLLRRTFTGDKDGRYVKFTVRHASGEEADFVYNIPSMRTHPAGLVSLASKGVTSSTVEGKSELRALLSDTLALWDTLCIRMRLLDADLPNDGYYLLWTDERDGVTYKSAVPARSDTLCFSKALFGTSTTPFVPVRLRHVAARKQDLASFTLRVLTTGEKQDLLAEVCATAERTAINDAVRREQLLYQYCVAEYCAIPAEQLPAPPCAPVPQR